MGWRLRIEHTTKVKYAGPVLTSFNEARMTPLTLPTQTTLESRVTVGPGVPVWTYNDYWGTYVSVFDLPEAHDDLVIRVVATVETEPFGGIPAAGGPPGLGGARREGGGRPAAGDPAADPADHGHRAISAPRSPRIAGPSPDAAAEAISACVRERVTYMPGATGVRTNAQEAWDKGQGVCQDMAQLTVALMRAAGLPARYVSGYLHPDPNAEPGTTAVGQSHAWVEYWAGVDPARPDQRRGRRRAARGRRPRPRLHRRPAAEGHLPRPAGSDMDVTVEVTRLV